MFDKEELRIIISVFEKKLERASKSVKECKSILESESESLILRLYDDTSFNLTKYENQVRSYSALLKKCYFLYDEIEDNFSEEEGCKNGK